MKSKASFEELIAEHEQKLVELEADPFKFDNQGVLKNAPSDEIREKIIAGRIRAIEGQIAKQRGELQKVLNLLK